MKFLLRLAALLLAATLLASCTTAQNPTPVAVAATPAPSIPVPTIPSATFTITDYGAVADGKTLNTAAIQQTIDACSAAGGGTVVIPEGKFLTGPLTLASNLNFHLAPNATLLFLNDLAVYPKSGGRYANGLSVSNAHDLEISGPGTIDGQGAPWWAAFEANNAMPRRPNLVVISNCTTVLVHQVTLKDSPCFHLVPQRCTNVTIRDLTITAPSTAHNTDAIDPSGWHFLITNCTLDTGDDNVAIKAGGRPGDRPSCEDFTITNCNMLRGHGLSIGSETSGGLNGLYVSNITFNGTTSGIRLKSNRTAGGLIENLHYSNITMKNVKTPIYITSYYPKEPKSPGDDPLPTPANPNPRPNWRDITFSNITITDCPVAGVLWGLPELSMSNLTFTNVHISTTEGMKIYFANNVRFIDSSITVQKGPPVLLYKAAVTGLPNLPADSATPSKSP